MMKSTVVILSLAWTLAACSSVGNSTLQDRAALDSIVAKQTTAAQVRNLLGEPAHVSTDIGGDTVWGYRLAKSTVFSDIKFTSLILQIHDGVVISKAVNEF